jgi:tRNA threonylcarbamoyladenosine biosynthesis protein TsaE
VLEPGDIVLLAGELGAGKTTLVQGIGDRLGVGEPMTSPTFTLMRTYDTSPVIAHVDVWRVEHLHEVLDLGLEEVLEDGGVAVIEWGDVIGPYLGRDSILVRLTRPTGTVGENDEDSREITIEAVSLDPSSPVVARVAELTASMRVAR